MFNESRRTCSFATFRHLNSKYPVMQVRTKMTIESETQEVLNEFLLQVTQAVSFQELEKAYRIVVQDFDQIKKADEKDSMRTFTNRYQDLIDEAKTILQKNANGEIPSAEQVAIFGEMVILRDLCLKRLE